MQSPQQAQQQPQYPRVVLDTQAFIYSIDPVLHQKLPAKARKVIEDADERLVSVLSVSEIALKNSTGKIGISSDQVKLGLQTLLADLMPLHPEHVFRTFALPLHHRDPFDRMIIAAALEENIPLIGGDVEFRKYKGLKVIWR
jgi:PIN domain nuclease of toxin-antitoxin system